ncbi:MAG: DUF4038 domain-containing protein [Bryobacteraceae bacterium]
MVGSRTILCLLFSLGLAAPLAAQAPCNGTPAYSPCDFVYELTPEEAAAHPNPYLTVQLHAEFRSPRFRTFLLPAFWDGGRRMVIRFAPTGEGEWIFRVTSNLPRLNGQNGKFTAAASKAPGFIRPANVHHWTYTENNIPHLWMGDTSYGFASIDEVLFRKVVDTRAQQKFNHIRGLVLRRETAAEAFSSPDQPNPAWFQRIDERVRYMNAKGIIADLVLAGDQNHLAEMFPDWRQRERYIRYLVARYAAMNVTWQGVQEFEEYREGRALLKEIGALLKRTDPYQHPRTTHTTATSAPLLADEWMDYVAYQSSDDQLCAIEHQLYSAPFVNLEFAYEDSGAGKSHPHHVDTDTFRRRLWNVTMDGQYPTFGNTGTYGGQKFPPDARYLDSPGARQMTAWFDFFAGTRHWELEPYFDVDGGRAVALEGVEYIVYVEKPAGPVELLVEKHGYDVAWFNPISGERLKQKNFKGERFTGEPPDASHDWVLHVSREGRKEGMLRSYKFESRRILKQEIETAPSKVPFDIEQPPDPLQAGKPAPYAARVLRETRATRSMMWLWTGETAAGGQGYRVLGTGQKGTLRVPPGLAGTYPATLLLHLYGMNANGKVYSLDRPYQLQK